MSTLPSYIKYGTKRKPRPDDQEPNIANLVRYSTLKRRRNRARNKIARRSRRKNMS